MPTINGQVSHWFDGLPAPRDPLPGDREADVCIVGAGFTGLWTAYYLKRADPSLRIIVAEARFAGFGASGRNGGWLSGLAPGHRRLLAEEHGRAPVVAWQRTLNDAVDEVIDVIARERIDADVLKSGSLKVARNPAQVTRLRDQVEEDRGWGIDDVRILTNAEAADRVNVDGLKLAVFTPHCARVQPARLARGLADAVERLGVTIYEQTPVLEIVPKAVLTPHGTISAPTVLRATEGFTAKLPRLRRRWLPMNSAMIATEPLSDDVWRSIGWDGCETLSDTAHGFFYAQRTADGRIAIGGRATPYRYGSRTDRDGAVSEGTVTRLTAMLHSAFPQTRDAGIAHAWCGVLGVPRDWSAGVALNRETGLGWAGGYVGHGVTASNLAGQTLADLVLERDTALVSMPWVNHVSATWEPEPLRYLGVRGMYLAYQLADKQESRGRATTSPIAVIADAIARRP